MPIDREILRQQSTIRAVRSGKKGGQHVNKVSSQAEVYFDPRSSALFTEDELARILRKLKGKISAEGLIQVTSQETRSLQTNIELAVEKLAAMLEEALIVKPRRKRTTVPRAVKRKRLDNKRKRGEIKKLRGGI